MVDYINSNQDKSSLLGTNTMTDNEITEEYFKALGMRVPIVTKTDEWGQTKTTLPLGRPINILESFSAFDEFVQRVMAERNYRMYVTLLDHGGYKVGWKHSYTGDPFEEIIFDRKIPRAAVIAATRYFKEKNG